MPSESIGQVLSCSPSAIVVQVKDLRAFEANKPALQIGRYLKIAQGNSDFVIATIMDIAGSNTQKPDGGVDWTFNLTCRAVGTLGDDGFTRGSMLLPVPTEPAYVADKSTLDSIFLASEEFNIPFGRLSMNKDVPLMINGDRFFSKHIAVVGSTGSGKSCTVAKMLQQVVGITGHVNKNKGKQNNSHIVIFDVHAEYEAAFRLAHDEGFTLNVLSIDDLKLPYWLMNSDELESLFIEAHEHNSPNQRSIFKQAVLHNKTKYNPSVNDVTYDNPIYFSIEEVYRYIENMDREVIGRLDDENAPKLSDGRLVHDRASEYFDAIHTFIATSTAKDSKANNGPFHGEFSRFTSRLKTRLSDRRLAFLLDPKKADGSKFQTEDFEDIVKQFLGYLNRANVTIVDLSGVPFEVLSITVSLISRIMFDFCFHYSKLRGLDKEINDVPVMLVCEEAHNYVPQKDATMYRSSRQSIERIAKEGRKYGLCLMVVSQRPSEVSETIFSQCNNFVALRLTNVNDQAYIKNLFPDNASGIADVLPNLGDGECIIVGDAVLLPAVAQVEKPSPEPHSQTVKVHQEWMKDWKDLLFARIIRRWRRESGNDIDEGDGESVGIESGGASTGRSKRPRGGRA